ncbi:MAG: shikimate kinase, partial [Beijerinckiaceae bacterium]|nr:shikimate kinase [Beijerinckiaceae bacterium]
MSESEFLKRLAGRSIILVGIMGSGKSSVGRRLAARLGLGFSDADIEIESAAGMSINEIFAQHGEPYFRDGERRVINRLLKQRQMVLATGGGAFMNEQTRAAIARSGISVWLKAEHDVLMRRVRKRANRPLLQSPDPDKVMQDLMDERYPVYATADITVISGDGPHDKAVDAVLDGLESYMEHNRHPSENPVKSV